MRDDMRTWFGFGVAGNFAGHLEQAGESPDFVNVAAESAEAPKGIFPFYVPGDPGFLGVFPLSHDRIARPAGDEVHLQIEPEVGVLARVDYAADGTVAGLTPEALGAFNDCSIRRPGAAKISEKKNWGPDSKGLARTLLPVTDLDPAGTTKAWRLASFLLRDGDTAAYGVDSPLPDYSYYGTQLLDWTVDRLQHQTGSPDTPLEPVGDYLRQAAGAPITTVLIGIGATRYTPLGASTYLQVGDTSVVVVYDSDRQTPEQIQAAVHAGQSEIAGASVLRQEIYAGNA